MLIGVVGKPSAGKSTLFKAGTLADVAIANYPFTTIKPNHAVGFVRIPCADTFFKTQCNPRTGACLNHQRFVPVDLLDVAGLVPGAHRGEGLGLQFLNDLNQADALVHVIDASGSVDANGKAVAPGSHDPVADVKFLEVELDHWYLGILKKGWDKLLRSSQAAHEEPFKPLAKQLSGLGVSEGLAKQGLQACALDGAGAERWKEGDVLALARWFRRRTKPMLLAANKIDLPQAETNVRRLKELFPQALVIPCSAEAELALKEAAKRGLISYVPGDGDFAVEQAEQLSEKQNRALDAIRTHVLRPYGSTGVQAVLNAAVFQLLKYKAIFPGGVNNLKDSEGRVLPDCLLLPEKATALDFAYKLHTDFGTRFVKAVNVKTKMPMGKDHILKDGDVVEIMARA